MANGGPANGHHGDTSSVPFLGAFARIVERIGFPAVITGFVLWQLATTGGKIADSFVVFSERLAQLTQSVLVNTAEQRELIVETRHTNALLQTRVNQSEQMLDDMRRKLR